MLTLYTLSTIESRHYKVSVFNLTMTTLVKRNREQKMLPITCIAAVFKSLTSCMSLKWNKISLTMD